MLSAEGILLPDIVLNTEIQNLDNALFCIHLQRQYSASREYEDYMASIKDDSTNSTSDPQNQKFIHALEKGRDNETRLNNDYMTKRLGEGVRFGDIIQLFHCKSGKYVTVEQNQLAMNERENMGVMLSSTGNMFSWLVVTPRFKIDRDGDQVQDASEMYLKVSERLNEFLHCAERVTVGHDREINCSLEQTPWRLNIFQSATDAQQEALVLASQLVYINDPETLANMAILEPELEQFDPDPEDLDEEDEEFDEEFDEDEEPADKEEDMEEHHHNYGNLVLRPQVAGDAIDSRALWALELKSISAGGPIFWRNTQVKLKNVCTGYYLELVTTYEIDEDGDVIEKYMLKTTTDGTSLGAQWNISEPNSTSKMVQDSKAYQLSNNGVFFERGDELEDKSYILKGTKDKQVALILLLIKYTEEQIAHGGKEGSIEPLDVHVGMASRNYLKKYLEMTVIPANATTSTLWPTAMSSDMETLKMIVERAVNFSQGFPISATNVVIGVDKSDPLIIKRRQKLLREQKNLDMLLALIFKLKPISEKMEKAANATKSNPVNFTDEERMVIGMGNLILEKCFSLLYYCILDNPQNQLYIADNLPVILAHLGNQPLAGKCVTEMLSKNEELQETKITSREIAIFVEKLRNSKMNPMYLQLLQACCSCVGKGVDGNQCKVVDMIFENTNDIIIQINADYTKLGPISWQSTHSDLYVPTAPIPGSPVMGEPLLYNGLPQLSLSWTTNSIDFSPLGLFGKLSVNVLELYRADQRAQAVTRSKKQSHGVDQKSMVADYFINQMYLGAEMCMDRNYVAMHKLDYLFPFDVLCTLLKMGVNDKLKAAAARLMLCLHVDRDPQAGTKIPVLTRTWSEVQKTKVPKLPYVEPQRQFVFALLQQMLSEHIENMAGKRWNDLSRRMLHLLRMLVSFKFYGSMDRMQDVVRPLINAIDRRAVNFTSGAARPGSAATGSTKDTPNPAAVDKSKPEPRSSNSTKLSKVVPVDDAATKYKEESKEDETDFFDDSLEDPATAKEALLVGTWQGRTLTFMDGLYWMIFILSLVAVAVTMTIQSTISGLEDAQYSDRWYIDKGIFGVFVVDLFLRAYVYKFINGNFTNFFKQTFNQIDVAVVMIDVIFMMLPAEDGADSSGGGGYAKMLRLVRMIRLLRILRAAKAISFLANLGAEVVIVYKEPARFARAPKYELDTMNEMVDILLYSQSVMQDRNLSIFLNKFHGWESGEDDRTPGEIFDDIMEESKSLTLAVNDFDAIFVDVVMFKFTPLVQGALDLLMLRHSTMSTLLSNAKQTQLLVSHQRERQFRLIDQMLQQLERNAETHELWGELTSDADYAMNKQTKDILVELSEMCRKKIYVFDNSQMAFTPEVEIQNLLRNLGCFSICEKVLDLNGSVEPDEESGELGEVALNTRSLCKLCNELVYWFALDNSKNQMMVYDSLDFFLESLDDEINSDLCIRAIFSNNEYLMKFVPHVYLSNLVDKIIQGAKSPQYLSLAVSITNVGDRNVVENQFEIVRLLTSPGRLQKVGCFLVPVNHPDYQRKRNMMIGLDPSAEYKLHQLDPELAYHLALLEVLAGCTAGRLNVSSIEAKIQSVFSYIDCIEAILDPACCLLAKLVTSSFLLNAIIEVELIVPGLGQSKCCWRLITSYIADLGSFVDDLVKIDKLGWDAPGVSRQRVDYQIQCICILSVFFDKNYQSGLFTNEAGNADGALDRVSMTLTQANNIIKTLYKLVRGVHQLYSPRLSVRHKEYIKNAVIFMNKSVPGGIEADLEAKIKNEDERIAKEALLNAPSEADIGIEKRLHNKYEDFLKQLDEDKDVQEKKNAENLAFISQIEELPYIKDSSDYDIRYEPFIKKLVQHVRENITIIDNETRIDARCTKTTLWMIKSFRRMIENKMGMDIFERDEDGGEEQDLAAEPVITAFNTTGVTELCLDLIADGVDDELQEECINLCVGMLFKEGGSRAVQASMNKYLSRPEADLFFSRVRAILKELIDGHDWKGIVELKEGEEPDIPGSIMLVRMLQLMSEGHFHPNQEIVRDQPNSKGSVNLLDDLVSYLKCLSQIHCRTSTVASIRVASTILEVLQGPCTGNQEHLALNTDILEVLNRIIRSVVMRDCVREEEIELKKTVLDILAALLEAQPLKSPLYERVLSVLHVDAIKEIALGDENGLQTEELTHDFVLLQTECLVLLQMLIEYHPALREELEIPEDITDGQHTASIEVLWNGEMNRRFFHVPEVCHLLSKASKDELVENVERSSQELKLVDFMERSRALYREVVHQRRLVDASVATIFSRTNMERITWLAFTLALTQNILFLCYFDRQYIGDEVDDNDGSILISDGLPVMPDHIVEVADILNYFQIGCASFVNIMMFVVRSPVIYQGLVEHEDEYSTFECIFYTVFDPMTMYYIVYNVIAVLALVEADYFSTFLLLDIIVKNSTAQNVLNAVVSPRWNIMMALVVTLFICYIFSWYIFIYYPQELQDGAKDCATLYGCLKFTFDYGIKAGEGVGEELNHDVGTRWFLDTIFFFAITTGVFNLVAGVIITTFGRLREEKEERVANTEGVCFICGIEKHVFDRAANDPDGFNIHIGEDHNMWAYLNFVFFLWEQDKDDDDGLEYFVRHAIEANNLDWIPSNKAMRLDQAATEEEVLQGDLKKELATSQHTIFTRIGRLEANLSVVLEQLTQTLKKDHKVEEDGDAGGQASKRQNHSLEKAPGEVSPPTSAWNAHRRKSPPYERPGTIGLGLSADLGGSGGFPRLGSAMALGNAIMEAYPLEMDPNMVDNEETELERKITAAPKEYQGTSRALAVQHIYLEVLHMNGLSLVPVQIDGTFCRIFNNGEVVGEVQAVGCKNMDVFFNTLKVKIASDMDARALKNSSLSIQVFLGDANKTASSLELLDIEQFIYTDGTFQQIFVSFDLPVDDEDESKGGITECKILLRPFGVSYFD